MRRGAYRRAKAEAARPMRVSSAGSERRRAIASAIMCASFDGTSSPVTPSCTSSGIAHTCAWAALRRGRPCDRPQRAFG